MRSGAWALAAEVGFASANSPGSLKCGWQVPDTERKDIYLLAKRGRRDSIGWVTWTTRSGDLTQLHNCEGQLYIHTQKSSLSIISNLDVGLQTCLHLSVQAGGTQKRHMIKERYWWWEGIALESGAPWGVGKALWLASGWLCWGGEISMIKTELLKGHKGS